MKKKLIYVMDIQCGWCYGNSKNIQTVYETFKDKVDFEFLNGGMWVGKHAPQGGEQISDYIKSQAPRLTAYTGMPLSESFFNLIKDPTYTLSSLEPSAAVVLIKTLAPEHVVAFAKEVQRVHFTQGKRLDELDTYLPILNQYNIDVNQFKTDWLSDENLEQTALEFQKGRNLANGFPTFLIQEGDSTSVLASGYFDLDQMVNKLNSLI